MRADGGVTHADGQRGERGAWIQAHRRAHGRLHLASLWGSSRKCPKPAPPTELPAQEHFHFTARWPQAGWPAHSIRGREAGP